MTHGLRSLSLAASLLLASTLAVSPQARAQSTSTAAHVYVQVGGQAGSIYGYSASSTGQLSPISGSPFNLGTQMIGSTSTKFITLGHTLLHSYSVASDGAIQSQLFQIPVVNYSGSSCGGSQPVAQGGTLDHTGTNVYVMFDPFNCTAYQSYIINSDGSFTFNGDTELPQNLYGSDLECCFFGLPSILGNETFAYAEYPRDATTGDKLVGFRRESSGALQSMQFIKNDPLTNPNFHSPDASPSGNYLVAQLMGGGSSSDYLASYTVDAQGNLSTTNTTSNMPTTTLTPDWNTSSVNADGGNSAFSPSGSLFVLYGGGGTSGSAANGIEIYNFNGASPLTLYKKLLTGTPIDDAAWDSSNHLYAISNATGKLYVFTVTSTSFTQDSTVSIGSPYRLLVVNQSTSSGGGSCTAPSTYGITVCTPNENASVTSPVAIDAAASISGGIYRFSLWNGSTKLLSEDNGTMSGSVSLAAGTYHLIFDARNSSGVHEYATRDITVGDGGSCPAPTSNGINVCAPTENASVSSPVTINASAYISGGIYRFSLWNGNTKLLSEDNGTMNSSVSLAPGTYKLTFDARNSAGAHLYATRDITVK